MTCRRGHYRARLALPGAPLHIIHRGNNRQMCFFPDEDHRVYLDWLGGTPTRAVVASMPMC